MDHPGFFERAPPIALVALAAALSPDFWDWQPDPGNQHAGTRRSGYVAAREMADIQRLWPRAGDLLRGRRIEDWSPLRGLVRAWGWPGRMRVEVPAPVARAMVAFARRLLRDLADMGRDSPGLLHWASGLAGVLKVLDRTGVCRCLEVETYTWDVLPPEYRTTDVCTAIARELAWVRSTLGY